MVDFNKQYLDENVIEYTFLKKEKGLPSLTFGDFISISDEMITAIDLALKESQRVFKAYFWECPSVCFESVDQPFRFVTVKSSELRRLRQDYSSFEEYFSGGQKYVTSFLNLGGDAKLVSPVPEPGKDFSHLAKFTSEVNDARKVTKFWRKVAEELGKALEDGMPKWLSTNGLAVPYLHVRIDNKPKYYRYDPYKAKPETTYESISESEDLPTSSLHGSYRDDANISRSQKSKSKTRVKIIRDKSLDRSEDLLNSSVRSCTDYSTEYKQKSKTRDETHAKSTDTLRGAIPRSDPIFKRKTPKKADMEID